MGSSYNVSQGSDTEIASVTDHHVAFSLAGCDSSVHARQDTDRFASLDPTQIGRGCSAQHRWYSSSVLRAHWIEPARADRYCDQGSRVDLRSCSKPRQPSCIEAARPRSPEPDQS